MYKKVVLTFILFLIIFAFGLSYIWKWYDFDKKIIIARQQVKQLSQIPTINIKKPNQAVEDAVDTSSWNIPDEKSQKWYIALGALVQYQNYETLELKSTAAKQKILGSLKNDWGVKDRQSAILNLDNLLLRGDRLVFNQMVATLEDADSKQGGDFTKAKKYYLGETFQNDPAYNYYVDQIWQNRKLAQNESLWAWDVMRLVNLARWSYTVGFITEEEAWKYIVPAGRKLQTKFTSWESASNNYLIGRAINLWSSNPSFLIENEKMLLTSPASPWVTINWNTKLN